MPHFESQMEKLEDAIRDANEVLKICARTGIKLYDPEVETVLLKVYFTFKDFDQTKTFSLSAYEKPFL